MDDTLSCCSCETSGPMRVSAAMPGPTLKLCAAADRPSTTLSNADFST